MLLNPFTFHRPNSLTEAAKLVAELEHARLQAGGTFLLNSLKLFKRRGTKGPEHVINLSRIPELKGVAYENGRLTIKAMTTITELDKSPVTVKYLPILREVCRNISTKQIRNMATVGGNLTCRYTWTEMPAVMIGLGGSLHFIDAGGTEETIDAETFYQQSAKTHKLFTHASIPINAEDRVVYRRVKKTQFVDIPMLSLLIKTTAKNKTFSQTRVAINNCVDFAQRDYRLESFLNGKQFSASIGTEALDHLEQKIYDKRSSEYKLHMFHYCIQSAIDEITNTK